jgi:hypothetical protein
MWQLREAAERKSAGFGSNREAREHRSFTPSTTHPHNIKDVVFLGDCAGGLAQPFRVGRIGGAVEEDFLVIIYQKRFAFYPGNFHL